MTLQAWVLILATWSSMGILGVCVYLASFDQVRVCAKWRAVK